MTFVLDTLYLLLDTLDLLLNTSNLLLDTFCLPLDTFYLLAATTPDPTMLPPLLSLLSPSTKAQPWDIP